MMERMRNELGLTPQQEAQVRPIIEAREAARRDAFREKRALAERVRALLADASAKESDFAEAVSRFQALEESDRRADAALVADMKRILSPRQQAQFLLFKLRFRQWLEGRMREARQMRRGVQAPR
jgi:Spy/CpxP family protein refolding chaperone